MKCSNSPGSFEIQIIKHCGLDEKDPGVKSRKWLHMWSRCSTIAMIESKPGAYCSYKSVLKNR